MKAPKCRICGKEHWTHEPHQFEVANAFAEETRNFTSPDGRFDRNAYQRAYMKAYRAREQ